MTETENFDIPTRNELLLNLREICDKQKRLFPAMIHEANEAVKCGFQLMTIDRPRFPRFGESVGLDLLIEFQDTAQRLCMIILQIQNQTLGEQAAVNKR